MPRANCKNKVGSAIGQPLGVEIGSDGTYGVGNVANYEGMSVYSEKSRRDCKAGGGEYSRKGFK